MTSKVKIHPLFIIIGCVFIFMGKGGELICYLVTLFIHEYSHFLAADKLGLKLHSGYLTPFGARISGELYRLPTKSEVVVALAGPAVNLLIAVFAVALWWLIPSIYPYTEIVVTSNLATALVNLLPAYPLDGGRVFFVLAREKWGERIAGKIMFYSGAILSALLLVLFLKYFKIARLYTLLSMSLFIALEAKGELSNERLRRKVFLIGRENSDKIRKMSHFEVDEDTEILSLLRLLKSGEGAVFDIVKNGKKVGSFSESDMLKVAAASGVHERALGVVNNK